MAYLDETGLARVWNKVKALIPTKTSDLTNDSGFLTQHQDISGKVDKVAGKGLSTNDYTTAEKEKLSGIAEGAEVNVQSDWNATSGDAFIKNKPEIPTVNDATLTIKQGGVTKGTFTANASSNVEINLEGGGSGGSTDWNDITNKPSTFPPTSHNHDDRYYTESEVDSLLNDKADTEDVPTKTSDLTNDSGFLTEHQDISGKQDKLVSGTNIKTINNQSLLGSGDIEIGGGSGEKIGDWDVVYFPDGYKMATTNNQQSYSFSSAGNIYRSAEKSINLPSGLFTEAPLVWANARGSNTVLGCSFTATKNAVSGYLFRANSGTASLNVQLLVFGK